MHPVFSLSKKKKNQWKCCIKPLIRVEHIRIILHAQSGSCYAAAYVVPLAPDLPPLFICAQAENATHAGRSSIQCVLGERRGGEEGAHPADAKRAHLSVARSQAEEIQMGPPFLPMLRCSPSANALSERQTSRQPNNLAPDTLFSWVFWAVWMWNWTIKVESVLPFQLRGEEKKSQVIYKT